MTHKDQTRADFEAGLAHSGGRPAKLRLYVAGMGPRSTQAISDVQRLCADYGEHCEVEIIDIYQHPAAASEAQVVAVPTLARERPLPRRKIIGTIGNVGQVARSLELQPNAAKLA